MKSETKPIIRIFLLLLIGLSLVPDQALPNTVPLPLSIDYQLLKSLVIKTAYTGPGQTATLLFEDNGCREVTISQPDIRGDNSHLIFETKVHIRAGASLLNKCMMPVEWEGYLALLQKPLVDTHWVLSFDTLDSTLYDKDHKPAKIAGIIWELVKTLVHDYLEGIRINLAPPMSELKSVLEVLFSSDMDARLHEMMNSMRTGKVITTPEGVRIDILTEVTEAPEKAIDLEEEVIAEADLERFIDIWESWDAFLVHMITSLSKEPLSEDERQILLDTLLETRHRLVSELMDGTAKRDFVREQFITAWEKLSLVFRHHLGDDPSESLMGYLAFFTAADALSALDKIGPTLGVEISRDGLIRLARLLAKGEPVSLVYHLGVNPQLREILGLGAPIEALGPAFEVDELEIHMEENGLDEAKVDLLAQAIMSFICKPAWGETDGSAPGPEEIRQWIFSKKNLNSYLERVKDLLKDATQDALKKGRVPEKYYALYGLIAFSTAWQESCFRQFKVKKTKVTYLLSYNRTSVGLMQINERVWRGLYDRHHLRWDIRYNAAAGCEILELYLHKYVLRRIAQMKGGNSLNDETLAAVTYAMYNGGPGQFYKFLKRQKRGRLYSSDKLYFEKYFWVKNDQWHNISRCLLGR